MPVNTLEMKHKNAPGYLNKLSAIKTAFQRVSKVAGEEQKRSSVFKINPALEVVALPEDSAYKKKSSSKGRKDWFIIWKQPQGRKIRIIKAKKEELLALKMVAEGISCEELARQYRQLSQEDCRMILYNASEKGLLIAPQPLIKREAKFTKNRKHLPEAYLKADIFCLQWHITNACDLNCRHCYDRLKRTCLTQKEGIKVLDDFNKFCRKKRVRGHVCFTGGNPFLSKDFFRYYKKSADMNFSTSILANPVSKSELLRLVSIKRPQYFQVSLEGLSGYNDFIRGKGHFQKTLKFLKLLKKLKIPSAVMLTLTKNNIDEVIPLSGLLKNLTDHFTFNRLSSVGGGTNLSLPKKGKFKDFLYKYVKEAETNPILGYKDNLLNIALYKKNMGLFGGCTGFGCGAAFNFLALLPDGQVHACRKYPSLLGNILKNSFEEIYDSKIAKKYRRRPLLCRRCKIAHVCGGCLSISYSLGKNIFKEKDPYCFLK